MSTDFEILFPYSVALLLSFVLNDFTTPTCDDTTIELTYLVSVSNQINLENF